VETDGAAGTQPAADGATVVPAYKSVEPSRAWDNRATDGPCIPSGGGSAFLAPQRRQRRSSDSDADSEATEGCDDVEDIDEGTFNRVNTWGDSIAWPGQVYAKLSVRHCGDGCSNGCALLSPRVVYST